jgi:hypothetical protein
MKIKFKELEQIEGTKADGNVWTAFIIHGTKLEDGSPWKSGNIFDNKHMQGVLNKCRTLQLGDKINIEHVKNGRFWNISDVVHLTEQEAQNAENYSAPKNGAGTPRGKASGGLSKEEWAEKDRVTSLRIAKSVGAKLAVEAGKKTVKTITTFAEEILPWLLDTTPVSTSTPVAAEGSDDTLNPPQ